MLRFGAFTLDRTRRGLYRDGERVHLTSKPLEVLIYLAEHRGRTVEKQELFDTIWKDTAVTEDTLVQVVREIRRVLGDDKANPRFVQTVPRRGYRFVAEVAEVAPAPPEGVRRGSDRGQTGLDAGDAEDPSPLPGQAAAPSTAARRISWWIGGGLALAGGIALAGSLASWESSRDRTAPAPVLEQLTSEAVNAGKPSFSPDGNFLYVSGGALHIRLAASDTSLQITSRVLPSGDMPVFTADGGHVVFSVPRNGEDGSRTYDLHEVPSIGGDTRVFMTEASGAGFSPDGKWVAYTKHLPDRKALWISRLDRLDQHIEVRARGFVPRWSPDGRWIAYSSGDPNATEGELWMASVSPSADGGLVVSDHTRLTSEPRPMYGLSWMRDGRSLIFAARRRGGPMHLYRVSTSGGVTSLTSGAGDYVCPSVSPDGKRVIFWHGTPVKNLMLGDGLQSANVQPVTDDEYHLWPALSPGGTHVASVLRRPTYEEHLYLTEIATKKRIALSSRPARHPSWIDDSTVAYLEDNGPAETDVRLVNIRAGLSPVTLSVFRERAVWLAVHPRRTAVAVVVENDDARQRIVLRQLGTREPDRTIAEGAEYEHLRWLPDGSALSWSGSERSSNPTSNGIWVMEPDASAPRRILADGYGPVWTPDGGAVYFTRIREYAGLWKYDLRTARETELRRWKENQYEFDIVGDRLVFTEQGGPGRIFAMSLER